MRLRHLWANVITLTLLVLMTVPMPARAGDEGDLARALQLGEVMQVLRDEGLAYGAVLDQDMLGGDGGVFWAEQVADIYRAPRMERFIEVALLNGMTTQEIDLSLAFFDTPQGQRILSLETSARRAMVDADVEQAAIGAYLAIKGSDDSRLDLITRLSDVNDLLEYNVAGSLNSNLSFMRGLAESGGTDQSEAQITAEIWSQESDVRADTEEWLFGFMLMAYAPLSDDDLEDYINYSATPAGQTLNAALFDGFDAMYTSISYQLGLRIGEASQSRDL